MWERNVTEEGNVCFHRRFPLTTNKLSNFVYQIQSIKKYKRDNFVIDIINRTEEWKGTKIAIPAHLYFKT